MRKILLVALVLTCAIGVASSGLSAAAAGWIEVRSPHFTVLSGGGEKTGRNVAWQFEQIRAALEKGWPWIGDYLDRPTVVLGAKDEPSMRALVPQYWEKGAGFRPTSVFAAGPDRHYLILRTDLQANGPDGVNPYQQAFWSYGALALASSANRGLPLWFTSGFREVLSNTNVSDDLVQFGRPMPSHLRRLAERWPYTLDQLFAVTRDSPDYRKQELRWDYDAESWLLMQYLLFGGIGVTNRDANANYLAQELLKGRSSMEVVTEVFGSATKLEAGLRLFMSQGVFRYARLKVDGAIDSKSFAARPVSGAEEATMRAALHAAMDRPADARTAIAEAARLDPALPGPAEVEGQLLDSESKDARPAFEKAVAAGSTNFYTYSRLAFLLWTPSTDQAGFEKIEELAGRAIAANALYAPAHSLLANVRLRLGKPGGAVAPARRAIELRPDEASHRLTLAEAAGALGDKTGAVKLAQGALALARTDDDRRRAQAIIARYGSE